MARPIAMATASRNPGDHFLLFVSWQPCEPQILPKFRFCDKDNLPRMVGKVMDDLNHGVQAGDVKALNIIGAQKCSFGSAFENIASLLHRSANQSDERSARNGSALRKFPVAIAFVPLFSQPTNNPLANIPAKMEHQVADTVGGCIRPPPNVFFVQQLEA